MAQRRPKNLNLMTIRLPLPALVSIMHRASGALLFLVLPLLLRLWQQSLGSPEGYAATAAVLHRPLTKLLILILIWAFLHHACAGMRHLALDARWELKLPFALASSSCVLVISGLLTLLAAVWLW